MTGWLTLLDKAPRLSIRIVIWILPSDTVFVNSIKISANTETAMLTSLTPKIWNSNNLIDDNLNLQALSTQMCFWPLQLLFLMPKATCCVTVAAIKSCHLLVPLLPVAKLAALLAHLRHRIMKQQIPFLNNLPQLGIWSKRALFYNIWGWSWSNFFWLILK